MSATTWKRVTAIEPRSGYKLMVTWEDAPAMLVSLADRVKGGRIFAPLADEHVFSRARIGEHGRIVEWPEPHDAEGHPLIDVDAETLLQIALQQRTESWFHRLVHQFIGHHSPSDAPLRSPPGQHPAA